MEEQIGNMKSGNNESTDPSNTSAAAPIFLYPSLVSSATIAVLPSCPDLPEDLLDTWELPSAHPSPVSQLSVPVQNLAEADTPVIILVIPDIVPYTHVVSGYE